MKGRSSSNSALAPTRQRLQTNNCTKKVRWTKDEDELLLSLIGKSESPNWSLIAASFPQKTTQQVTERWEKVLNPNLVKGSWTREEDETIIKFVQEFGSKNWTRLSSLLPGRIGKQCRERWRNHLDPSISHATWTKEEDDLLMSLHEKYGNAWVKISAFMPNRSDNAIKNRWNSTLHKLGKSEKAKSVVETTIPLAQESHLPFISFVSPFGLMSPLKLQKKDGEAAEAPASSPRVASSVASNREKLIGLIEGDRI